MNALRVGAQSSDQNYITATVVREAVSDASSLSDNNSITTIQYFDGLGRPVQTVQRNITPASLGRKDLATYTEYDGAGRESRQWLPAVISGNNGAFVSFSSFSNNATNTYADSRAYNETQYEPSPLNRVTSQYGSGQAWAYKPVTVQYGANDGGIAMYMVNASGNLQRQGNYSASTLYKTTTADEDGKTKTEYKDKLGRVVMTQNSNSIVRTYYVYNDLGQLSYVIPPIAADSLPASGAISDDNGVLKRYAYLYKYDAHGNCTAKRLPGCDWIYMVYDRAERLILSQDGNQRTQNPQKWTANWYDELGRLIITSEETTNISDFDKGEYADQLWVAQYQPQSGAENGYMSYFTGSASTSKYLTVNYYDNYLFLERHPEVKSFLLFNAESGFDNQSSSAVGLITGTRTYILDGSGRYNITVYYYDYRGRVIQTRSTNHLNGYDYTYNQYDFSGNITRMYKVHNNNISGQYAVNELYTYTYDHANRLLTTTYKLNNNSAIVLSENEYDNTGRLVTKKRHNNTTAAKEEYTYNIRNWPTRIKSGDFEENLYYTYKPNGEGGGNFNGNIAYQTWTYNGSINYYSFEYDNLNRLTNAINENLDAGTDYSEALMEYDKHGNLKTVTRGLGSNGMDMLDPLKYYAMSRNILIW
jgi:hypothetical protein